MATNYRFNLNFNFTSLDWVQNVLCTFFKIFFSILFSHSWIYHDNFLETFNILYIYAIIKVLSVGHLKNSAVVKTGLKIVIFEYSS